MKKCFSCGWKLPLFLFQKDKMKYQRPSDKGRVRCCRVCTYRKWIKEGEAWLYDFEIGKFQKVVFKNKMEILKRLL